MLKNIVNTLNKQLIAKTKTIFSLFVLFSIFVVSCSSNLIEPENFSDFSTIKYGDNAKIAWKFKKADFVLVDGITYKFGTLDSFQVSPQTSSKYKITAFSKTDTLYQFARVDVENPPAPKVEEKETSTGDEGKKKNTKIVEYCTEYSENNKIDNLYKIKIMGLSKPKDGSKGYSAKLIAFDNNGVFIPKLASLPKDKWLINHYTRLGAEEESDFDIDELHYTDNDGLSYSIAVENSKAANSLNLNNEIVDFLAKNNSNDFCSIYGFNQDLQRVTPLTSATNAVQVLKQKGFEHAEGLSATCRSLKEIANDLIKEESSAKLDNPKYLVLISFSTDNASIDVMPDELVNLCNQNNISVYTIGVGNSVNSYLLKKIAAKTGGKYYSLDASEKDDISEILQEIYISEKHCYFLNLSDEKIKNLENYTGSEIVVQVSAKEYPDRYLYDLENSRIIMPNQAIAAFEANESKPGEEFKNQLMKLKDLLVNNPKYSIELVGHSCFEGDNEDEDFAISRIRTQNVKKTLVTMGVPADRIKEKALGNNKPIYFIKNQDWQSYFNRRVEIRWVKPGELPYEMVVAEAKSEREANDWVKIWESRGYENRCYYEGQLVKGEPLYQIKIWKFATIEQANSEVRTLKQKYQISAKVE